MKSIKSLLLSLFAAVGIANAQTDVSSKYMVNADFSNGTITNKAPEGWTLSLSTSGVQSKISTEEKANGVIAGGQNHWQLWQASGALKGKAFQPTSRLPLGRYKLTAALVTSFSDGELKLYLGSDSTTILSGNDKTYEVETMVTSETPEAGLYIAMTNGALLDLDNFTLYRYDLTAEDAKKIVEPLYNICVADTLSKGRQKWFNRDEMIDAMEAYKSMGDDDNTILAVATKLQQAHDNFQQIKSDYVQLRTEASSLYTEIQKLKFAYVDSVYNIRKQINSYYLLLL